MITKRKINLVAAAKHPFKSKRQMDRLYVLLNLIIAFVLVAVLITAIALNVSARGKQEQALSFREQIARVEAQLAEQISLRKRLNELTKYSEEIKAVLATVHGGASYSAEVFKALWETLAETSTLDGFSISGSILYCTIHADFAHDIVDYVDALRGSELFSSVGFSGSISGGQDGFTSRLVIGLNG